MKTATVGSFFFSQNLKSETIPAAWSKPLWFVLFWKSLDRVWLSLCSPLCVFLYYFVYYSSNMGVCEDSEILWMHPCRCTCKNQTVSRHLQWPSLAITTTFSECPWGKKKPLYIYTYSAIHTADKRPPPPHTSSGTTYQDSVPSKGRGGCQAVTGGLVQATWSTSLDLGTDRKCFSNTDTDTLIPIELISYHSAPSPSLLHAMERLMLA